MTKSTYGKAVKIFCVFSCILTVGIGLTAAQAIFKQSNFFSTQILSFPGLWLSATVLCRLSGVLFPYKSTNQSRKQKLTKFKWLYAALAIAAIALLAAYIIYVFYVLKYHGFFQAVGMDQSAYFQQNRPFILLGAVSIIMNVLALVILFSPQTAGEDSQAQA